MIKPSIGRVVWVYNRHGLTPQQTQPEPALICFVHSDSVINVAGFDCHGDPFKETSIELFQGEAGTGPEKIHAAWMPYQQAQAAKHVQEEVK